MDALDSVKSKNGGFRRLKMAHTTRYEKYNGVKKMANKLKWKCMYGRRLNVPKDCMNNYWCQAYQKVNKQNSTDLADNLLNSFELSPCEFYLETVLPVLSNDSAR
jgi:hypothetical protein